MTVFDVDTITEKSPANENDVKKERIKKGECAECGMIFHNIVTTTMGMSSTREPPTTDSMQDGRCLVCNPIFVGNASLHGALNEINNGNDIENCFENKYDSKNHTDMDVEKGLGSGDYAGGLNGKNNAEKNAVLPNDSNPVPVSSPNSNESQTQNDSRHISSCERCCSIIKSVLSCMATTVELVKNILVCMNMINGG